MNNLPPRRPHRGDPDLDSSYSTDSDSSYSDEDFGAGNPWNHLHALPDATSLARELDAANTPMERALKAHYWLETNLPSSRWMKSYALYYRRRLHLGKQRNITTIADRYGKSGWTEPDDFQPTVPWCHFMLTDLSGGWRFWAWWATQKHVPPLGTTQPNWWATHTHWLPYERVRTVLADPDLFPHHRPLPPLPQAPLPIGGAEDALETLLRHMQVPHKMRVLGFWASIRAIEMPYLMLQGPSPACPRWPSFRWGRNLQWAVVGAADGGRTRPNFVRRVKVPVRPPQAIIPAGAAGSDGGTLVQWPELEFTLGGVVHMGNCPVCFAVAPVAALCPHRHCPNHSLDDTAAGGSPRCWDLRSPRRRCHLLPLDHEGFEIYPQLDPRRLCRLAYGERAPLPHAQEARLISFERRHPMEGSSDHYGQRHEHNKNKSLMHVNTFSFFTAMCRAGRDPSDHLGGIAQVLAIPRNLVEANLILHNGSLRYAAYQCLVRQEGATKEICEVHPGPQSFEWPLDPDAVLDRLFPEEAPSTCFAVEREEFLEAILNSPAPSDADADFNAFDHFAFGEF